MKKICKKIPAILLSLLMILSLSVTALADDSTLTFRGVDKGFDAAPGSKYTTTDLFDGFKDVMPGDQLTETVRISNEAGDCDYIKLYLRMVLHDEQGNPLTYDESFEYRMARTRPVWTDSVMRMLPPCRISFPS